MGYYRNEYLQLGYDKADVSLEYNDYEKDINPQEFIDQINTEISEFRLIVSAEEGLRKEARADPSKGFKITIGSNPSIEKGYNKVMNFF